MRDYADAQRSRAAEVQAQSVPTGVYAIRVARYRDGDGLGTRLRARQDVDVRDGKWLDKPDLDVLTPRIEGGVCEPVRLRVAVEGRHRPVLGELREAGRERRSHP